MSNPVYTPAPDAKDLSAATASRDRVELQLIDSVTGIESLRSAWDSRGHRDSNIDFFLEFLRTSRNVERPHVLALVQQGQPRTLLIGRLEHVNFDFRIGYLHLPSLSVRALTFSYGGLRGNLSEDSVKPLVESVIASLARGDADVALFHQVDVTSRSFQFAKALPNTWCRDRTIRPQPHYVMTLADQFEEVLKRLSRQHRNQLRSINRKFPTAYDEDVRVHCFKKPEEFERAVNEIETIAKKTYQRGLGVGFIDLPEIRQRLRFCAQKGWFRAYVLYAHDTPCSFWIGTVVDESFCSDYLAFDPAFSEHSPGTYLQFKVLEELCKEGVRTIDFGPGPGRYKERFADRKLFESNVYIFAPHARGLLLNGLRTFTWAVDRILRNWLERTNLLSWIKRYWRGHAARPTPTEG